MKIAPKGALDYELGYQQMRIKNAANNADGFTPNANLGAFSLTNGVANGFKETIYGSVFYHLSKRTEVYLRRLHEAARRLHGVVDVRREEPARTDLGHPHALLT